MATSRTDFIGISRMNLGLESAFIERFAYFSKRQYSDEVLKIPQIVRHHGLFELWLSIVTKTGRNEAFPAHGAWLPKFTARLPTRVFWFALNSGVNTSLSSII
jgi:hypothetical protein